MRRGASSAFTQNSGLDLVVWAGNLSSVRLYKLLRDAKIPKGIRLFETNTIPYGTRLRGPGKIRFWTRQEGRCWFFGVMDHCVEDLVGWHVAKVRDRCAALEPIRQGVQQTHGSYAPKIALGLGLRTEWGPQYTAHQFLGELRWLGIRPTPSYVGEPECNEIIERWMQTLKEECLYLHDLATLDEARKVIGEFIERYNHEWLLERHGYRTPAEVRRALTRQAA